MVDQEILATAVPNRSKLIAGLIVMIMGNIFDYDIR
jgi:hypothetical protein